MAAARKSRKWPEAVAALMGSATLAGAALRAGVSERTLRGWLRDCPEFKALYQEARREALDNAVRTLQAMSGSAAALVRNMTCGVPAVEVRAALGILEHAQRGVDLADVLARVERLEKQREHRERQAQAGSAGTNGWHGRN